MKSYAPVVAIVLALLSASVKAETVETSNVVVYVGATHFSSSPNGIWWQEAFPHRLHMNSASYSLEWTSAKRNNFKYGVNFSYMGKASSQALATSDESYVNATNTCIPRGCDPLVNYNGVGKVTTLEGIGRYYYKNAFVEMGLGVIRPTWDIDMPNWTYTASVAPIHLHKRHNPKLQAEVSLAVGYEIDDVIVKFTVKPTNITSGDDWIGVYRGLATNLSVGYKF